MAPHSFRHRHLDRRVQSAALSDRGEYRHHFDGRFPPDHPYLTQPDVLNDFSVVEKTLQKKIGGTRKKA
ncbi:MAG: hypothetical protein WBM78_20990 [Desulfobacterales bacterium]